MMHKQEMVQESFHERHERLAAKIYNTAGMLPDRYVFILTNLCNLQCPFCFLRKDVKTPLAAQEWICFAKQLPDYARVTLTGGEPLLFKGFEQVFSFVAERFDCNVITNGTLLTKEHIDLFLSFENFRVLSISVDSIDNTVRKVRMDLWDHARKIIRYFLEQRRKLSHRAVLDVKTLILDENAADLYAIHKYCVEEIGCDHHVLQFLKGSPIQHSDLMYDFADIEQKSELYVYKQFPTIAKELEKIVMSAASFPGKTFLHPKLVSFSSGAAIPDISYINSPDFSPALFQPCKFPWSSVHINADGHLFPCLAVAMGNIRVSSLTDIINGKLFGRFRKLIMEQGHVEACARCGWLRPVLEQGAG